MKGKLDRFILMPHMPNLTKYGGSSATEQLITAKHYSHEGLGEAWISCQTSCLGAFSPTFDRPVSSSHVTCTYAHIKCLYIAR